MEQRNLVLRGIATVLNAVGSSLVTVYDLTASALGMVLQGEKEKLKGKIREYEQNIERLYYEVGKEVSKEGEITRISAAGEAAFNRIAEYQVEIEKIKQGIQTIEAAERQEKERVLQEKESAPREERPETAEPVIAVEESDPEGKIEKEAEPEAVLAEPSLADTIVTRNTLPGLETETEQEILAAEAGPAIEVLPLETSDPEAPVTDEASAVVEKERDQEALTEAAETPQEQLTEYTPEMLGNKLKGDLLALCMEKGIEAQKTMTKAEIIELIVRRL